MTNRHEPTDVTIQEARTPADLTRQRLLEHAARYPLLQIEDVFKFLHQSALGCEHMVRSQELAVSYIESELAASTSTPVADVEELDGDFCRVHLSYLRHGLSPKTLGRIFFLSAKPQQNGASLLQAKLEVAYDLIRHSLLPISPLYFISKKEEWRSLDFAALHHSSVFKSAYAPAYRVINRKYVDLLPLLSKIDRLQAKRITNALLREFGRTNDEALQALLQEIYENTLLFE